MEITLSRRKALLALAASGASPVLLKARLNPQSADPDMFQRRIGQRFVLDPTDSALGERFDAELVKVTERPGFGRRTRAFSLMFRAVKQAPDVDARYTVAHAELELPDVHVGRVLARDRACYYEVVFN